LHKRIARAAAFQDTRLDSGIPGTPSIVPGSELGLQAVQNRVNAELRTDETSLASTTVCRR
jgi:hypothetical protein